MFPLSPCLVCEEERETKIFRSLSSSLLYLLKSPANSKNFLRQKIPYILDMSHYLSYSCGYFYVLCFYGKSFPSSCETTKKVWNRFGEKLEFEKWAVGSRR